MEPGNPKSVCQHIPYVVFSSDKQPLLGVHIAKRMLTASHVPARALLHLGGLVLLTHLTLDSMQISPSLNTLSLKIRISTCELWQTKSFKAEYTILFPGGNFVYLKGWKSST
jgi:hypothetical protein